MKIVINKHTDCCGNCAYWCGEREIHGFFGHAEVEGSVVNGRCNNRNGMYNANLSWMARCGAFEKHPAIKR